MQRLDGKVAIVTGAGSGIGQTTAEVLAGLGAKVVVADINAEAARGVAGAIAAGGAEALAVACDVAEEAEVAAMVRDTVAAFGSVDILHNNAAITAVAHQARDGNVVDMDVSVWDKSVAAILRGSMLGCKYAIPHMVQAGGGSIINTASASALSGDRILTAYSTAKAGIIGLTKSVATAFGRQRVRCNAIAPGMVMTPSVRSVISPERVDTILRNNLMPYAGEPEDIAWLVAFLASDASKYITGELIRIDGGLLSHLPTYASTEE